MNGSNLCRLFKTNLTFPIFSWVEIRPDPLFVLLRNRILLAFQAQKKTIKLQENLQNTNQSGINIRLIHFLEVEKFRVGMYTHISRVIASFIRQKNHVDEFDNSVHLHKPGRRKLFKTNVTFQSLKHTAVNLIAKILFVFMLSYPPSSCWFTFHTFHQAADLHSRSFNQMLWGWPSSGAAALHYCLCFVHYLPLCGGCNNTVVVKGRTLWPRKLESVGPGEGGIHLFW